ncbi:ribonuclease [Mycobacteroides saopaulense]|uniref:ribonuclease domain-containing protein n=1 Tax=Mycobacteroides saopaulense TaxID=1578165 RepID=UPI00071EF72C|nr:ribonuclease domain-containing protein [Mycobacteroides saopaulense]ALR11828.1 ribonuclease [Mycobacteroides saopaulense]
MQYRRVMSQCLRVVVAALLAVALIGCTEPSPARATITQCDLSALPSEASGTVDLIHEGGPFPYPRNDGVVFQNRERILPSEPRGYYHEYTVRTPGSKTRGTRRIITGGTPLTDPPHVYYTGDHYQSFCEVEGA